MIINNVRHCLFRYFTVVLTTEHGVKSVFSLHQQLILHSAPNRSLVLKGMQIPLVMEIFCTEPKRLSLREIQNSQDSEKLTLLMILTG